MSDAQKAAEEVKPTDLVDSGAQGEPLTTTATKDETPAAPVQQNTAAFVSPNEDVSSEPTPIGDEAEAAALEYLKDAKEADLTHFDEDDDPLSLAGDFVDEDGDGVDDRKQGNG